VASNSVSYPQIYAAWVYYAFGAVGIASDIDYISAVDTANYIFSGMRIKNTSSPTEPLTITGGYGRDSVTEAAVTLIDTTGGTIIAAPDHVVSYASGSGLTALQDANLSATAAATTTYLDSQISDCLQAGAYVAPDNANIVLIKAKTDNLPTSPAAVGSEMSLTEGARNTLVSAVWAATTRTLSSFGTLASDVWAYATRALTDKANFTLASDYDAAKTAAQGGNVPTAAENATAVRSELSAELTKVSELHTVGGLDAADPVALTGDGITTKTATTDSITLTATPSGITRT